MMKKIGFIGLGEMGLPMAGILAEKGFPLAVYDVEPTAIKRLESVGAVSASNPAGVADHSDLVLIIVRTTAQVHEVLFGDNGVTSSFSLPSVVSVMSTISPVDAVEIADKLKDIWNLRFHENWVCLGSICQDVGNKTF